MKIPIRRHFRTWLADLRVKRRYGTVNPSAIRLPGCDYFLEIDPTDRRARQILVRDGIRGKATKGARLWRALNDGFKPEVLVDVGLNYGECLMGSTYPTTAALFGFEANPHVFECASRSRKNHPNAAQLNFFNILVTDVAGPERSLFVDPSWSGTGTAVEGLIRSKETVKEYKIAADLLDNLIPEAAVAGKRMMFKIDIEGYEPKALKGFTRLIGLARDVVGLIEFDTRFLRMAETDPNEFLADLNKVFRVFSCGKRREIQLAEVHSLADLPPARDEASSQHTDLLLIKRTPDWLQCLSPELASQVKKLPAHSK
jgi:FkbM family methyltransferase